MSFLTLWLLKQTAGRSGIDAHRCKPPGQSSAAFLCSNSYRPSLLAFLFARRQNHRNHMRQRCGIFRRCSKTLEEIADQSPQSNVFRGQIFHRHHCRCVQSTEPPPPSIERPKRYACSTANFRDRHARAGFVEQMKNFVFGKLGTSHRIAPLICFRTWNQPSLDDRVLWSGQSNITASCENNLGSRFGCKGVASRYPCRQTRCLVCSHLSCWRKYGPPLRNPCHAGKYGMGIP